MDRPLLEMSSTLNGLLVALVLLVIIDAQGPPDPCIPAAKVRKNSFLIVTSKSQSRISCPVTYCEKIPTIKWVKISDMDTWTQLYETDQITITEEQSNSGLKEVTSHLSFKSISKYDSGVYRCKIVVSSFSSESHNINVSVSADSFAIINNATGETTGGDSIGWLPYIFICSGIIGLVTVVLLISFLSIYGCRCSKAHRQQHAASCLVPPNQNLAHGGTGCSQARIQQPNKVTEMEEPDISLCSGMGQGHTLHRSRDLQENSTVSRSQQIVYAFLEHLPPRTYSGSGNQLKGQLSEYASLRIC
ncbi:uncharacterized protein si:ch211-214p13.8 [Electrophorus electricus]|uniref:Ig-like domain-containing protein n=1 Tax=Electrophorus electricus TaxID=8005 RepID=A0A4W4GX04_ELEEL|nr:uncharacterized protein si:ch211-214p13.8 [Electrophorus electricus]